MTTKTLKEIALFVFISFVTFGLFSFRKANSIALYYEPAYPVKVSNHRALVSYDEKTKMETLVVSPEFSKSEPQKTIAYWKFDEGSGTSVGDSSGNLNTGKWVGNTADNWSSSVALSGHSGQFNGVDNFLNFPHSTSFSNLSALTVSAWVYMTKLPEDGMSYLVANKEGDFRISVGPTSAHFVVQTTGNGWYSSGTVAETVSQTCKVNSWCYLVGTYDGSYTKLFIDGELAATGVLPISGNISDSYTGFTLGIGTLPGTEYFLGYMDEAKLFNYALTVEDIKKTYADVKSGAITKTDLSLSPRAPLVTPKKATYGLLMPVPSKPEVEIVKDTIFTSLEDLTKPVYDYKTPVPALSINGFGGTDSSAQRELSPVKIVETKKVDVYDILVIEPTQTDGLQKWFTDNGYKVSDSADFILKDYAAKGYYFVLAKINLDAFGGTYNQQINSGHINPLKLTFKSDSIVYPIKLAGDALGSAANSAGGTNGIQLEMVAPQPSYYPPYQPYPLVSSQYFTVYTIMNDKAYIPGFNVEYAGNIEASKLEKLATQDDNSPWEKFEGRKYLTKLSRYLPVAEMHNDIVITKADDNKPVGSGVLFTPLSQPVKIFLIILVPLVAEVCLFIFISKRRKHA